MQIVYIYIPFSFSKITKVKYKSQILPPYIINYFLKIIYKHIFTFSMVFCRLEIFFLFRQDGLLYIQEEGFYLMDTKVFNILLTVCVHFSVFIPLLNISWGKKHAYRPNRTLLLEIL